MLVFVPVSAESNNEAVIQQQLKNIGVHAEKIDTLTAKIINNEVIDSLNEKYDYIEPTSVKEDIYGVKTEEYIYPDGSKKILQMIPEEHTINGQAASRASFNTWIDNVWSSSGSGYSTTKFKVNGTYGIVTMTYYANVTYVQGGATTLTSVSDPGILVAGPGVSYSITEQPRIVRNKPSSSGYAESVMKAKLTGDFYSGTYALRFFVKPGHTGYYATLGLN